MGDLIDKNNKQQIFHKILINDNIEININKHSKLIANC